MCSILNIVTKVRLLVHKNTDSLAFLLNQWYTLEGLASVL